LANILRSLLNKRKSNFEGKTVKVRIWSGVFEA